MNTSPKRNLVTTNHFRHAAMLIMFLSTASYTGAMEVLKHCDRSISNADVNWYVDTYSNSAINRYLLVTYLIAVRYNVSGLKYVYNTIKQSCIVAVGSFNMLVIMSWTSAWYIESNMYMDCRD